MADAKMEMKIPEQFIKDTIYAELVRQMPNKEEFAAQVIRYALEHKANSYDRETTFQAAIRSMIQETAKGLFQEWLSQHKDAIREALLKELNRSKAARLKKIAEDLASGLSCAYATVNVHIKEDGR